MTVRTQQARPWGWRRWWRALRRRGRHWWAGLGTLFRGNIVVRRNAAAQTVVMPILLLHGFGTTRRSLEVLEQRLRADGFDVFSLRLGGLFGTVNTRCIAALGTEVLEKLTQLRTRNGLGKFVIIGHSKGGLLGRYLVSCLTGAEHIHGVITMGTPHQGYPYQQLRMIGRWSLGGLALASVREMQPYSRFFNRLRASHVPESVHCVSICSPGDRVVPPDLCLWEIANRTAPTLLNIPNVSHTDYLLKPRVYDAIRTTLREMQPCVTCE